MSVSNRTGVPVDPPPGVTQPTERPRWWVCPNTPPCPHAGVVHDIYDWDDQSPRCCVDGCPCGGES